MRESTAACEAPAFGTFSLLRDGMVPMGQAWRRLTFALRGGENLRGVEDEYTFRTFHCALMTFLLWDAAMILVVVPLFAVRKAAGAGLLLVVGLSAALALALLRRRRKRAAAALFLIVLWCGITIYGTLSGGVYSGSGFVSVVVALCAAWLLGAGPAAGFLGATLLVSLVEALLEAAGWRLPVFFPRPRLWLWLGQFPLIALTIGPIIAFARTLQIQIAALRESEERFRSLSDASVEGMMIDDGESIISCNLAFARMFGYERPDELIGRHPVNGLVSDESKPRSLECIRRPETESFEITCIRKDGSRIRIEAGSRSLKYNNRDARLITCRDVSERNRAIEAQRESEERYRALFERSLDCVFLADFEGHLLDANQAWMDLLGYSREDFSQLKVQSLLSADQLPAARERMAQLVCDGSPRAPQEYRMRRKDGGEVFLEIQSSLLYRLGAPVAILAIGRDMTERRQAEAEKAKLEAQLHESQRMESIGRLAGGIAHDFNNLLTVINGYSKVLVKQLDNRQGKYAAQIHKAGESAANLTRQLLAFSRMEVTRPRPVLLNDIVADSRDMLARLVGDDIEVETRLCASRDEVMADPGRMQQCLMNLVANARDAMPEGGRLIIETADEQIDQRDLPAGTDAEPGPHVRLTVRDTGVGMDAETCKRIFEPFFTTKDKSRGTGLGLSIVYGIVSQWRGFIRVKSQPGAGSELRIYLPVSTGNVQPECERTADKPVSVAASETVMVVEDQDMVREFVVESLRGNGYSVLEARNGPEALEILEQGKAGVHLLMTDVLMPGMRGNELAARAHALCPSMKVLFMTGYADGSIDDSNWRDGKEEVLMKPFSTEVLEARVRNLLGPVRQGARH